MKSLTLKNIHSALHQIILQSYSLKVLPSSSLKVLQSYSLILALSPFLLFSLSSNAQYIGVRFFDTGNTAFVKYYDGHEMQRTIIPNWKENPVFEWNENNVIHRLDLRFSDEENQFPPSGPRNEMYDWIEPGVPVEGDMPSDCEYSKDGSIFAFIYQLSDNVIFYNATTFELLASVQVATQPVDLEMGKDHAYVCCHAAHGVVEISLDDFTVTNYITLNAAPCQVQVSPGDDTVYIAFDTFLDGWITAVDLNSNQVIYDSYYPYIHNFGHPDPFGRTQHVSTKFWLSPAGNKFMAGDTNTRPAFYNAFTGVQDTSFEIGGLRGAGFSPSGDTCYVYTQTSDGDSVMMCRINTLDNSIIDSIKVDPDLFVIADYTEIAINHDGSKVLAGDSWNSKLYLFDFEKYTCQVMDALTTWEDPVFPSSDGEYVVHSSFLTIEFINFDNGERYDTWATGIRPGWPLCGSPVENKLVAANGTIYSGNEYLFSFNFKNINDIFSDTTFLCGEAPEADAPVCADLLIQGINNPYKIISANAMSQNLSIIDFETHHVDKIIPFTAITGVKIVPGSDIAIVYGSSAQKTQLLDLTEYAILATFDYGQIEKVFITSDGLYGYLMMDLGVNEMIIKLRINGAASTVLDEQMFGASHCDYQIGDYTIQTTSALSPDEQLLLFGDDDPQLGAVICIVDAQTLELITKVPVPDECIYGFAFTDDSKRVIAVGDYNQAPIIYLDRENSFVENSAYINYQSFAACYNPVDGMFYVLEPSNYLHIIDPLTGIIGHTLYTYNEDNLNIGIDQEGKTLIITAYTLIYDGEEYPLPGPTSHLSYFQDNDLFIIPVPGPDVICVFDPKMVGIQQFKPGNQDDISISPNPVSDLVVIRAQEDILHVKMSNMVGEEVFSADYNDQKVNLTTSNLKPGIYLIRITTKNGNSTGKLIVNTQNP
jgi:hypothetical protein